MNPIFLKIVLEQSKDIRRDAGLGPERISAARPIALTGDPTSLTVLAAVADWALRRSYSTTGSDCCEEAC